VLLTDRPECGILSLIHAQEPPMTDDLKDSVLSIFEASLDAQLRAVRRLRQGETAAAPRSRKGRSQVDMAYDVLKKARSPLDVSELLARIQSSFGVTVDRESLVSALSQKKGPPQPTRS